MRPSSSGPAHANLAALPFWLTCLFLAALLTVSGFIVFDNYRNALKEGEARALSSAHVVAAHFEWMVEASDQALQRMEAELARRPIDSSASLAQDLSQAVGELPPGFEYSLLDERGEVRFTDVAAIVGADHSERNYFKRLRDGQALTFSRLLDTERADKPSFIIARRIMQDSAFRGVASISIPNEALERFWASLDLGAHSTISVVRDDGRLIARRPAATEAIDLSGTEWFPWTRNRATGIYHSPVSPIDGLSRVVAFWKVPGWPLLALAAIERQEVLDHFWRNLLSDALIMLPLMAVLVFAAFWINRLLSRTAIRNEELEQALERNHFLLREIHHRVKNNLQAVLALIRLQPLPQEARDDMARRIAAMIAVHEQIYETDQFEVVDVAPYAEKLITDIASGYDVPVEVDLNLAPIAVDRDQALPLGMIINEIVSNSFKYAFSGRSDGRLTVDLSKEGDSLLLVIRDNGPGMDAAIRSGMGSRLIGSFVRQLGGQSSTSNDGGTVFRLTIPLEHEGRKTA